MFKFKNFKILLLLMLFAFAVNDAWAGGGGNNWWCYQIEVDVKLVTGEGLVYDPDPGETPGTIEVGEVNKNGAFARSTAHVLSENKYYFQEHTPNLDHNGKGDEWVMKSAVPNTQNPDVSYIFKGWMYAGNAGDGSVVTHISTGNPNFVVGEYLTETDYVTSLGGYAFYAKTQHKCTYTGENGVSTGDQEHINAHNNNPPVYTNDAIIYALFEKQELTPAVTILYDVDKCEVEYPVDYQTNAIGNTITITARRKADTRDKGWEKEFVGWADEDGNIVSTDNPWTLNIEKKAVYRAVIEDRYRFFRIKNYGEPYRYVSAISDEASSDNFMDLMDNIELLKLNDNKDEIIFDAGSIVQIDVLQNPYQSSATYVDITAQDSKASKFYIFNSGVTINSLPYDYITKTWNFKAPLALFRDDSGVPKMQATSDNYSKWIIEHLDLDLETCENYFSLDPTKLAEVDGKYYTTLRTSWNILFNPEQMTPYVVTEVDETEGTFEMEPITGNIIPLNTPVIIETKSNDVEENRMVPTLTNAASGAVPSGNLLQHSEKYFPNQTAPVSNCKGLYKNANGQLAFGGNALSTVNGNEAYLSVANEVVYDVQPVITETTLANLLDNGEIGPNYKITDLTCVYIQGNTLYCKDDDHALNKSIKAEGEEDYIKKYTALQNGDWDQSNWIAINLPEGSSITTAYMNAILDHRLNNVVGRLKSKINPEFDASLMPSGGDENPYNENTYITCNFSGEHQQGVVNGKEVNLFFVAPKPMEIAQVEWAMWDAASEMFIMPHAADDSGLHGAFLPNFSMLENVSNPNPQDGYGYHFPALIKLTETSSQSSAPVLAAGNSSTWTVFPLEWNTDTPTAISSLQTGKAVTRVVYYNLMGVESDKAHPGINIVVTEYSDGSRTAVKVIK